LSDAAYGSLENALNRKKFSKGKKKRTSKTKFVSVVFSIGLAGALMFAFVLARSPSSAIEQDYAKPIIMISEPWTNSTITGESSGAVIGIDGMSADSGSGLEKVEVRLISATSKTTYQVATPFSPGDWSAWSYNYQLPSGGIYTISAKATDYAGNKQWSTSTVNVILGNNTAVNH